MKKPNGNGKEAVCVEPPDLERAIEDCKFTIRYLGHDAERVVNICRTTLHFYSVLKDCLERLQQQERKIDGLVASGQASSSKRGPDVYRQARPSNSGPTRTNGRTKK